MTNIDWNKPLKFANIPSRRNIRVVGSTDFWNKIVAWNDERNKTNRDYTTIHNPDTGKLAENGGYDNGAYDIINVPEEKKDHLVLVKIGDRWHVVKDLRTYSDALKLANYPNNHSTIILKVGE